MSQLSSQAAKEKPPMQWSIRSLLWLMTAIGVWLAVWRIHFLAGLALTVAVTPSLVLFCIPFLTKAETSEAKIGAFILFVVLGVTLPAVAVLTVSPAGSFLDVAERVITISFYGALIAASLGAYVVIGACVLEMIFGKPD